MKLSTEPVTGLEISTRPLAQASVKTTLGSTNPRLFVAFIKGTRPMASALKIKFPSLLLEERNIEEHNKTLEAVL